MRQLKKKAFFLLTAILALAMALCFTSCGTVTGAPDTEYTQYLDYVRNATEANITTPFAFDEWAKSRQQLETDDANSAYRLWKDKGNVGSESDFFNWILKNGAALGVNVNTIDTDRTNVTDGTLTVFYKNGYSFTYGTLAGFEGKNSTSVDYTDLACLVIAFGADGGEVNLELKASNIVRSCAHTNVEVIELLSDVTNETQKVKGVSVEKCLDCGFLKVVSAAHDYIEVIDLEPTCETTGLKHNECKICGGKKDVNTVIPKKGHSYENNPEEYETVAPTCTEKGYDFAVCTICGEESEHINETSAKGHKNLAWEYTEEDGKNHCVDEVICLQYCKDCGKVFPNAKIEKPLGHLFADGYQIVKAPSFNSDGLVRGYCERCKQFDVEEVLKKFTLDEGMKVNNDKVTYSKDGVVEGTVNYIDPNKKCDAMRSATYRRYLANGEQFVDVKNMSISGYHAAYEGRYVDYENEIITLDDLDNIPDWINRLANVPLTCASEGSQAAAFTCCGCSTSFRLFVRKSHTVDLDNLVKTTVQPECETTGTAIYACKDCKLADVNDKFLKTECADKIDALGHSYTVTDFDVITSTYTLKCAHGETKSVKVDKSLVKGYDEFLCHGDINYAYGEWTYDVIVDKAVTATAKVKLEFTKKQVQHQLNGKAIDISKDQIYDKNLHNLFANVEPPCDETANPVFASFSCSLCNNDILISVKGNHNFELKETIAATCTVTGTKKFECSACGKLKVESIAVLGHDWEDEVTTVGYTVQLKRTCRRDGCGEVVETGKNGVLALPDLAKDVIGTEKDCYYTVESYKTNPTCVEEGVAVYYINKIVYEDGTVIKLNKKVKFESYALKVPHSTDKSEERGTFTFKGVEYEYVKCTECGIYVITPKTVDDDE